jgi:hypothetical protein
MRTPAEIAQDEASILEWRILTHDATYKNEIERQLDTKTWPDFAVVNNYAGILAAAIERFLTGDVN